MRAAATALLAFQLALSAVAVAERPPCAPCAGLAVDDPSVLIPLLESAPPLSDGARLYLRWPVALDGSADETLPGRVAEVGAVPWLVLSFDLPAPIADSGDALADQLAEAARIAAVAPANAHFEIAWSGDVTTADGIRDFAFLLKRASVAVTGARDSVRLIAGGVPSEESLLAELYAADVAAYIDGVEVGVLTGDELARAVTAVGDADPGRPVVHRDGLLPADRWLALSAAARARAAGAAVTFFLADPGSLSSSDLEPLLLLAGEFAGDLAFDPYSTPSGGAGGWAFVRAEDLGLKVILDRGSTGAPTTFTFADGDLQNAERVLPDGTTIRPSAGRVPDGYMVEVGGPERVAMVRLARPTAAELGGFARDLEVTDAWQMPVEEILRRLQAFEDAQSRRIHHYEADYTQHFRYRPGSRIQVIEVSFSGPYFYRRGQGFDWVWRRFLVNGVLWKGRIPKLPLLQPERAAARPLEITFDRQYRYRLRGTAELRGRSCWVVDFEPDVPVEGRNLWNGTVWVDRELYARVKTRALQVGLAGDVISNEETQHFEPMDAQGQPAPWSTESFFLPTRVEAQELLSVFNAAVQVEKQSLLTEIRINQDGFEDRVKEAHTSRDTMVRDTPDGLRYLDRQEDGSRELRGTDDPNRWFALGGTYWDEGQDYPVPLAGIDFFSSDFLGTGSQVNLIFAGLLINGNWADPSLFGSRWDAGARVFGIFVGGKEKLYRDGELAAQETVKTRTARLGLFLGRPIGNFIKAELAYRLEWDDVSRADDTGPEFVLPESGLTSSVAADLYYSREGFRLALRASYHDRDRWSFWGQPGNTEYDPSQKDYQRWSVVTGKTWWPGNFTKIGVEVEHLDGSDLDRFSKYDFSTFGTGVVAGYPDGLVTASEADGLHLVGGLNIAEAIQVEGGLDLFWATDEATGLDREPLAGIALSGTVIGPWRTIVNFEIGVPLVGPASAPTVFVTFLKLFG